MRGDTPSRIRTCDLLIRSQTRYPLRYGGEMSSYLSMFQRLSANAGHGQPRTGAGSRRRGAVILALLCLLSLAACVTIPAPDTRREILPDPMRMLVQPFSPEEVIAFIGAPFPPSATGVQTMGEAALDTMVVARFEAPRPDVLAYLADLGITEPLTPGSSPFFSAGPPYAEAAAWWTPPIAGDKTGNFSGLYQQVGSKHYNVALVDAGGGRAIVYLQVFNT